MKISHVTLLALWACAGCGLAPDVNEASVESQTQADTHGVAIVNAGQLTLAPPTRLCQGARVQPDVATDGQRIYLDPAKAVEDTRVVLVGYRYNDAPPSVSHRQGEGREQTYCGCQRVHIETQRDPDGVDRQRPFFVVPSDAPSGDYSVALLSTGGECMAGGIRATACPDIGCINPSLSVVPSYVVSTSDYIKINGNSEDNEDNPSEMSFVFASWSGAAFGDGDTLVSWSGGFPGGGNDTSHVTHADQTFVDAHLPLFVGRESLMTVGDCREECVASSAANEAECTDSCNSNQSLGRYNDQLEFAMSGMEYDSSPSKAYGIVAGIAAGALACAGSIKVGIPKTGCTASVGLGVAVSNAINNALADDDDNLGVAQPTATRAANWNVGTQQTLKLGGPSKTNGDIDLSFRNQRVAAPRILSYAVRLKSIELTDSYEECGGNNDLFLNARVALHQGESQLPSTQRFPATGTWAFTEGQVKTFSPPLNIASQTFPVENAPESPFMFVELGVWEDDGSSDDKDLIGVHAETLMTGELLGGQYQASEETTSEGFYVRRVKFERSAFVHGYAGSDNECYGIWAHGWDPQASEGAARLTYEVELTWLKAPKR